MYSSRIGSSLCIKAPVLCAVTALFVATGCFNAEMQKERFNKKGSDGTALSIMGSASIEPSPSPVPSSPSGISFGQSPSSQLGDDDIDVNGDGDSLLPLSQSIQPKAIALVAAKSHTCALLEGHGVTCWGGSEDGQIKTIEETEQDETDPNVKITPTLITAFGSATEIKSIEVGSKSTCVIKNDNKLHCVGKLLEGSYSPDSTRVNIEGGGSPINIGSLSISRFGTDDVICVNKSDSNFSTCKGKSNSAGQLGRGNRIDDLDLNIFTAIKAGGSDLAIKSIITSGHHTCATSPSGELYCWGDNSNKQVSNGGPSYYANPRIVTQFSNHANSIALGEGHTCAIKEDGESKKLFCWGYNEQKQADPDAENDSTVQNPKHVNFDEEGDEGKDAKSVIAVTAGTNHTCAIVGANKSSATGQVKCWGNGYADGVVTSIVVSSDNTTALENVREIKAGAGHTCAISEDGKVYCWGLNNKGQLGDGTNTDSNTAKLVDLSLAITTAQ
ncbi:MAG: hypothetical protein AAB116_17850 [Candidatus Poribacteria bacterium]